MYLIKRVLKLNYHELFKTISIVHKKTGKNRLWLFFDIVNCGIKYGAGYSDYKLNEFYNLNGEQRATYVTRGINNRLVAMLNNKDYYKYVEDKSIFNKIFSKFIGREWIDINSTSFEAFSGFMEDKHTVISKPFSSTCGVGVKKHIKSDYANLNAMYDHLKEKRSGLLENYIIQHKDINNLYPHSVNSIRIVTVLVDGSANVIYAFIRIGNDGRFVDNINAGGMAAPIDLNSGKVLYPAFDKNSKYYEKHPLTQVEIAGFKIPYWEESIKMCLEAAKLIPELGYIGWDIAVTDNGPLLIEANHFPGHDILQMPPHVPDKIGMLPRFRLFVKNI